MKICPVALAVGCPKCPVFKICPAKASLGGYVEALPGKTESVQKAKAK